MFIRNNKLFIFIISSIAIVFVLFTSNVYREARVLEQNKYAYGIYPDDKINKNFNAPIDEGKRMPLTLETIEPFSIIKVDEGHYFIEFNKTVFGTIQLIFENGLADENVEIRLGENKWGNKVWSLSDGGIIGGDSISYYKTSINIKGGKESIFIDVPERFRPTPKELPGGLKGVIPFRYCEIIGTKNPITDKNIRQIAVFYPFNENASKFNSSNKVLNDIWDFSKYTIKATSYCGLYVDGNRERKPYEADAYINQLGHYNVDNEYTLARYTQDYLIANPTWPTEWIMHSIFMAYADYMYTGDSEFLRRIYPELKARTLQALEREDGLISTKSTLQNQEFLNSIHYKNGFLRDIVDWPENERDGYDTISIDTKKFIDKTIKYYFLELKSKLALVMGFEYTSYVYNQQALGAAESRYELLPVNTVVNAFHYRALYIMSKIAESVGEHDDAYQYNEQAVKVKKAIQDKLFDYNKGLFVDGEGSHHSSLHANMFPLAFDLVPDEYRKNVISYIESKGMACSVYGSQYLLEGLYMAGEADYAMSLLTDTSNRSWAHMIYDLHSTLTLEAWDNSVKPNQDWNHAWGAVPANIIPRWVMGIIPVEPGFKSFLIKPQPSSLDFAAMTVPTIRGNIDVAFRQSKGKQFNMEVNIPSNTKAFVYIPKLNYEVKSIVVDSKPIKYIEKDGDIYIGMLENGKHNIEIINNIRGE